MSLIRTVFVGLVLAAPGAAFAQAGFIDPSFGGGTQVITSSPWGMQIEPNNGQATWGHIYWLGVQSTGKVVAVGRTADIIYGMGVARFNSDGSLDASFGQSGSVTGFIYTATTPCGISYGWTGVIDSADRIIVIETAVASQVSRLFRFTAAGALDTTFGSGGVVSMCGVGNRTWNFASVAVQPDNKIVVGAFTIPQTGNSKTNTWDATVARFNSNGTLDSTFGNFGHGSTPGYIVDIQPGNQQVIPECLAVQSDGKIVLAAWGTNVNSSLNRYLSTGAVDTGFGVGGHRTFSFSGGLDQPRGIAIDSSGRIVMTARGGATMPALYMARFSSNGALDLGYGGLNTGWSSLALPADSGQVYGLRLQGDGRALLPITWPDGGSNPDGNTSAQAVLRFTAGGVADASFGPYGTGLSELAGWVGQPDSCRGLAMDPLGRIIVAGTHSSVDNSVIYDYTRGIELTAFSSH